MTALIWRACAKRMRTCTPSLNVTMKEYQQITVSFTILYHVHVTLLYTQCLYAAIRSSTLSLSLLTLDTAMQVFCLEIEIHMHIHIHVHSTKFMNQQYVQN